MPYKLSPEERRLRALLVRANQRSAPKETKNTLTAPQATAQQQPPKAASAWEVGFDTFVDVSANPLIGVGKALEGINDFAITPIGWIGGLFSKDFKQGVQDFIEKDFTNDLWGNAVQNFADDSLLNNNTPGRIIEGVEQGVGQMLPAVIVSVATAGAGAPAAVAQALSLATTIASAAGTATEEAFKEGATYEQGALYGAAVGAVEGATEKLVGGAAGKVFGKGLLDNALGSVAKTGIARVAADAIGEGAEEVLAEVASPALKTIYKGKDALSEYGDGAYWKGVAEAGIIGAGTSLAYGGTVGKVLKTSGVYADARSVMEDVDAQLSEMATLEEKGKLTPEREADMTRRIKRDYQLLSGVLQKASPDARADILQSPAVASLFESDGTLKADVGSNLDARLQYAEQGGGSPLMSRGLYGREAEVSRRLAEVGAELYKGDLTEAETENLSRLRKVHAALSREGLVGTDYVIAKESADFHAFLDGKTVVIGKDTLTDGSYLRKLVHEVEHFTEGTKEWGEFAAFVLNNTNTDAAVAAVLQGGYGVTQADVDGLLDALKTGNLTKGQRTLISEVVASQSEVLFGDEQTILKLTRTNRSLAEKILDRIKAFLEVFKAKTAEERAVVRRLQKAEQLFEKALEKAGTKYALRELTRTFAEEMQVSEETENTSADSRGEIQFSRMNSLSLSENVERVMGMSDADALANKEEGNYISIMKTTPSVVTDFVAGAENLEIVMRFDAFYLATRKSGVLDGHYHNYGDVMKQLPEILHSPLAIVRMDNGRLNFFAVVPHLKGSNNIVSVELNTVKDINSEYKRYNLIVTVTPAKDNYVRNLLSKRGARIEYQKEDLSQVNNQLYEWLAIINDKSSTNSIPQNGEMSTPEAEESSGTPQFSRKPSDGVAIKNDADAERLRVYTKKDAAEIISHVVGEYMFFENDGSYGQLVGKPLREAIDALWRGLNSAEPGMQGGVALDIAEYIINNATVASIWEQDTTEQTEEAKRRLGILRGLMHKLDLSAIKGEIAYKLDDKKGSAYLVWGARKGQRGLPIDGVAAELRELGIPITAEHPAEIFFEILDLHRLAVTTLKGEADTYLGEVMTEEERASLKQDIAKEILRSFDTKGKPSKLAETIVFYEDQISRLRAELKDARNANGVTNRVLDKAQRLRDLKAGRYLTASQYREDIFKGSIGKLAAIRYRGNLREAAVRDIVRELGSWYHSDNPLYKGEDALKLNGEILEMMRELSSGEGRLTNAELEMLGKVMDFFVHEVENFNKVYREGRWQEARPIAEGHIDGLHTAKKRHRGDVLTGLAESGYMRMFADPLSLMRRADAYERGFFTESFENLRKGAIKASVTRERLMQQYEGFFKKHKGYDKRYFGECITYRGRLIAVNDAISLYMTLYRDQAYAGLVRSGFQIDVVTDDKARTSKKAAERIEGFATPTEPLSEEDVKKLIERERAALRRQFTEEDLEMIDMMEAIYRQCAELKKTTDLAKQGYTNLTGGYYYPIKRAQTAETVDRPLDEISRVSGLSFNKDTVKGAKGELLIEAADVVLRRHVEGIAIYAGLAIETDNINRLLNLNISENRHKPVTIKSEIGVSTDFVREMWRFFKKLQADVEGTSTKPQDQRAYDKWVRFIRSGYAKYQLGANPKVWFTQMTSLVAATNVLDVDSLLKGFSISGRDVDSWCELAWLRNVDDQAVKAETVLDNVGRVGDFLMKPIGAFDRMVVVRLFAACQAEVEKKQGLKVGTKENKQAAGELLERVILDTQQNSIATERSAAMRSPDEFLKGFTMFSADSMKCFGRFADALGEAAVLREELKRTRDPKRQAELEERLKAANEQARRSTASLVATALFGALVSLGFKWLYNKDDEENVSTVLADAFGNMLGGLPLVRDVYSFFQDGFEMDHFLISTGNTVLKAVSDTVNLVTDAMEGKKVERRDVLTVARKVLYAAGQLAGIPTRNIYNVAYGLVKRTNEPLAYAWDSNFVKKSYSSDLAKAIEAGDDRMIGVISGLMIDEKIGIKDDKTRNALGDLTGKGYSVLPRSVGDTVTLNGEAHTLTVKQQKRFRTVYGVAEEAVADLVRLKQFAGADDAVKEKAIRFIYDVYWDLALEDVLGEDLAEKNVLFAEAIDIEKLAIIIAMARSIEADRDKNGKVIAGSKKRKVEQLISSLNLTAAQKYMVMGYLGYSNTNGRTQVERYIGGLNLTKTEKQALLQYSGYAA